MLIHQETPEDFATIYQLVTEAFASAEYADGTEQDLVAALRDSQAFLPELSLVAELDGQLAGHILFTKAAVGGTGVLALAPLSVRPRYQRRGVGLALIARGHQIAAELGYPYSLVLGSNTYYPRAGYLPAAAFGIEAPAGFPPSTIWRPICWTALGRSPAPCGMRKNSGLTAQEERLIPCFTPSSPPPWWPSIKS